MNTKDLSDRARSTYASFRKRVALSILFLAPLAEMMLMENEGAEEAQTKPDEDSSSRAEAAPTAVADGANTLELTLSAYDTHMIEAARFRFPFGKGELVSFERIAQTAIDIALVHPRRQAAYPLNLVDDGGLANASIKLQFTERQLAALELLRHDLLPGKHATLHEAIVGALRAGLRCMGGDVFEAVGAIPMPHIPHNPFVGA